MSRGSYRRPHLTDLLENDREGCGLGPGDATGEDPLACGGGSGAGSHSSGSTSDICAVLEITESVFFRRRENSLSEI